MCGKADGEDGGGEGGKEFGGMVAIVRAHRHYKNLGLTGCCLVNSRGTQMEKFSSGLHPVFLHLHC